MTETIPGGCYLAADGKSYIDANGEPVSAENVAKFKELQAANARRVAAQEAALAQQNLSAAQVLTALVGMKPTAPVETEDAGKVDAKAKTK